MTNPELKTCFKEFKTSPQGWFSVTEITDVKNFSRINVEIIQDNHTPQVRNLTVRVHMGKISGTTLSQVIDSWPLDSPAKIRSYQVTGPEINITVEGGPANTTVGIQAWVFLQ
jgi:hypothetical protein